MLVAAVVADVRLIMLVHETRAAGGRCEAMILLGAVERILHGTEIVGAVLLVLRMMIFVAATQAAVRIATVADLAVQRLLADDHTGDGGQTVGRVTVAVTVTVTVTTTAIVHQEAGQRDRMPDGRVLMLMRQLGLRLVLMVLQ